jgi:site-specific recombinase XerD
MKMNKAELEFVSLLGKFFTDYLPISMAASPNTMKSYKCAFRLLFHYLNDIAKIDTAHITFEVLDFDLLTSFFDWLTVERKNSRTTAKIRLGALSSFAEYAQNRNLEAGYVFRSSLEKIYKKSFRRVKGKQRCAFSRHELEIFLSMPDTSSKIGWRNLVLLVVMYASGARAQEICDLTTSDIAYDQNGNAILTLMGKGNKLRRVKITADATALLDKYIAYRKIRDQPDCMCSQAREMNRFPCPALRRSSQNTKKWLRMPTPTNSAQVATPHTSCDTRPHRIWSRQAFRLSS